MSSFRFIHCSDLHIDSPFKGLRSVEPELAEKLRASTFQAFQNIIDLAIAEEVDAVVIAGDIYDGADKSLQAQLKFKDGLTTLSEAGIPSYIAHGNHDPLDSRFAKLGLPDNATVFSGQEVECHSVERDGKPLAKIYGISYPTRDVTENLALKFEKAPGNGFSIGVLHANVGKNRDHENYAPCSVEDLVRKKMDYWALGHVHLFQVLSESDPAIVYPGNTQARHKKETGKKGCCLVTLHEQSPPEIKFIPTDTIRIVNDSLDLSHSETLDQVIEAIRSRCLMLSSGAEERDTLIHLKLTGRTVVHDELRHKTAAEDLSENIQSYFEEHSPAIWVKLILDTQGAYDIESLKQGNDFIADLLTLYEKIEMEEGSNSLYEALSPLFENWAGNKYLDDLSQKNLQDLLRQARNLSLDYLAKEE